MENQEEVIIRIKTGNDARRIFDESLIALMNRLQHYSHPETIELQLRALTGSFALRFFLNHFDSMILRLGTSLKESQIKKIAFFAQRAAGFYRINTLDESSIATIPMIYDLLNHAILGKLAVIYLSNVITMDSRNKSGFDFPNSYQMVKLLALENDHRVQERNASVRLEPDGLVHGLKYSMIVEAYAHTVSPIPFYDYAFVEMVENSKLEPYELVEFFVEEWPLTLDAPMPPDPSPADVLYTGGVLNAIFIAFPIEQILTTFDLVTCYLVRFIDANIQDEFTKKCQVYSELIKKIPKSYAPLTTMKPNRHRDAIAKHILRFTRHDLKKLVSKLPDVDIGFIEDKFITTNPKDSSSFQEQKESILQKDPRRLVLSILRTPLIRVGKEFLTSSMLIINSYMDFIQTTARRSKEFRHRKGIALEHGLCASMMKLGRTTKLILIQSQDDSKWNFKSRINLSKIREETQRWKIPLEEIVIPNLPYPYMEFDLVLEVDGYPPLFIEAKANSFTNIEYTLGFNSIYSRMLEQHQKLRKKLAIAIEHEDFLIRFGTDIEGLLLSQDSVLSAGILDLRFKDLGKIHQALRRLVDDYGVTPRTFGDGLVAIFGNELEHN